jgi:hypothetical protein
MWLCFKKNCDCVYPHEPLINDIHCLAFWTFADQMFGEAPVGNLFISSSDTSFFQVCNTLKL